MHEKLLAHDRDSELLESLKHFYGTKMYTHKLSRIIYRQENLGAIKLFFSTFIYLKRLLP